MKNQKKTPPKKKTKKKKKKKKIIIFKYFRTSSLIFTISCKVSEKLELLFLQVPEKSDHFLAKFRKKSRINKIKLKKKEKKKKKKKKKKNKNKNVSKLNKKKQSFNSLFS